jgi:hypothetical protein
VPIKDIHFSASESGENEVSAEILFAKLIGSMLADAIYAPLTGAPPTTKDVESRTSSAHIQSAVVHLRPNVPLKLPNDYQVTLADPSQITIEALSYETKNGEKWEATTEIDLSFGSPTILTSDSISFEPKSGHLKLRLDASLTNETLSVALSKTQPKAECQCTDGLVSNSTAGWSGNLQQANLAFDTLSYKKPRPRGNPELVCSAQLAASASLNWSKDEWRISGLATVDKVGLSLSPAQNQNADRKEVLRIDVTKPVSIKSLTAMRELAESRLSISIAEVAASGTLDAGSAVAAMLETFKASGGKVLFSNKSGLQVAAEFATGATMSWKTTPEGQTHGGAEHQDFAVKGTAKIEVTNAQRQNLTITNVALDLKSLAAPAVGISMSVSGNVAISSDVISLSGVTASVDRFEMRATEGGRVTGNASIRVAISKNELARALQSLLAQPHTIPGRGIGRILAFDGEISEVHVDSSGLRVSFPGAQLHVEGAMSARGTLTTRRRIVITFPIHVDRTIVNHNDFNVRATVAGIATASFPAANVLASQQVALSLDYQRVDLDLGGVLDLIRRALEAFHIVPSLRDILPRNVMLPLFKGNIDRASLPYHLGVTRLPLAGSPELVRISRAAA